jgi:predicted PhzF superfamily epimerase YddE/YHI9
MAEVKVARVFADNTGSHGNLLGIVTNGTQVPLEDRLAFARKVGYSATVFIDDLTSGAVRIYTPVAELDLAGHPLVGAAWTIGTTPMVLRPPAGVVEAWREGDAWWIRAALGACPPWWHERLHSPADIAALDEPLHPRQDMTQLWAWEDEAAGRVRARVFAGRLGIAEDEACGSATMRLAAALGCELTVRHGSGSIIHARPGAAPGTAEIGGRVVAGLSREI